jgi:hypothetical protein
MNTEFYCPLGLERQIDKSPIRQGRMRAQKRILPCRRSLFVVHDDFYITDDNSKERNLGMAKTRYLAGKRGKRGKRY